MKIAFLQHCDDYSASVWHLKMLDAQDDPITWYPDRVITYDDFSSHDLADILANGVKVRFASVTYCDAANSDFSEVFLSRTEAEDHVKKNTAEDAKLLKGKIVKVSDDEYEVWEGKSGGAFAIYKIAETEVEPSDFLSAIRDYPQHEQEFPESWGFDPADEIAVTEAPTEVERAYEEEQHHNFQELLAVKRHELDDFIECEPVMKWLMSSVSAASRVSPVRDDSPVSLWHRVEIWRGDDHGDEVSVFLGFQAFSGTDEGKWCIVVFRLRNQFRGTDYPGEAQYFHLDKNLELNEILKRLKPYTELNAHDLAEAYSSFGCGRDDK